MALYPMEGLSGFDLLRRRTPPATTPGSLTGLAPLQPAGTLQPTGVTPETYGAPKPLAGQQPLVAPSIAPPAPGTMLGGLQSIPTLQRPPAPGGAPPAAPTTPGGIRPLNFDLPASAGGGPLQEYGPGNDLRSTQINPYTGERLRGVQQGTDVLFRSLAGGPDLTQAALEKFKLFGEQTADQRQRGIRDIGQAAARLGRLGSGMVTTDLGNLEERLRLNEDRERRGLASDLAFGEGAERRANLGAGAGFESQLYGQGRGLREEARGERGFQEDQARSAFEQEILRRQLQAQYEQQLRALGLQGAQLYGNQAAAGQQSAADLLAGAL